MRYFLLILIACTAFADPIPVIQDWRVPKLIPDHKGIETPFVIYNANYRLLALLHGIKFTNDITIGFSYIRMKEGEGHVVGLCTYNPQFREIDVDPDYWKESTLSTRQTLIFHEMTHCLCGRDHDWGIGVHYPEANTAVNTMVKIIRRFKASSQLLGFLPDGCPMSIMYPYVIDDKCMYLHEKEYLSEMFERCRPY